MAYASQILKEFIAWKRSNLICALMIFPRKSGHSEELAVLATKSKWVSIKICARRYTHALRVDFAGNQFKVTFDGKIVIQAADETFKEAGAVGVWTKADSVTLFDDFSFGGK